MMLSLVVDGTETRPYSQITAAPDDRPHWPFVLLLFASLGWLGLVAGTAIGAAWFVPEGSGLAGPAIALGYGVLGLLAGLALGAVLGWKAGHGLLQASAAVAVVLALLTVGAVIWRIVSAENERRAEAGLDVPLPPPAGFRLESRIAELDEMRRYRELTIDGDTWTATWTAVGPEAATCTATLRFVEADALLRKRIEVRQAPDRFMALCSVPEADSTHVYALREADPGSLSWEVFADARCLQEHGEVAGLHWMLGRIPIDAVSDGRARCGD
jgi:hypothetical protein